MAPCTCSLESCACLGLAPCTCSLECVRRPGSMPPRCFLLQAIMHVNEPLALMCVWCARYGQFKSTIECPVYHDPIMILPYQGMANSSPQSSAQSATVCRSPLTPSATSLFLCQHRYVYTDRALNTHRILIVYSSYTHRALK